MSHTRRQATASLVPFPRRLLRACSSTVSFLAARRCTRLAVELCCSLASVLAFVGFPTSEGSRDVILSIAAEIAKSPVVSALPSYALLQLPLPAPSSICCEKENENEIIENVKESCIAPGRNKRRKTYVDPGQGCGNGHSVAPVKHVMSRFALAERVS